MSLWGKKNSLYPLQLQYQKYKTFTGILLEFSINTGGALDNLR